MRGRFMRALCGGVIGALLGGGALGCGAQADPSTPEGVARAVVTALDRGMPEALLAVLPPDEALAASFDCGPTDHLRAAFQRRREDARAELAARRAAGHRVKLLSFDDPGSATSELAVGEDYEGCRVTRPVTIHRARLQLSLSKSGRADKDGETWIFFRFEPDGPWYFGKH